MVSDIILGSLIGGVAVILGGLIGIGGQIIGNLIDHKQKIKYLEKEAFFKTRFNFMLEMSLSIDNQCKSYFSGISRIKKIKFKERNKISQIYEDLKKDRKDIWNHKISSIFSKSRKSKFLETILNFLDLEKGLLKIIENLIYLKTKASFEQNKKEMEKTYSDLNSKRFDVLEEIRLDLTP